MEQKNLSRKDREVEQKALSRTVEVGEREHKKCGVIAIVGRPNVGKSTLTNALVGEKIAIVTPKPQTTRNRITGVVNRPWGQAVLLDTPGLHKARSKLDEYMTQVVRHSVADVDGVLLLVEPVAKIGEAEEELIQRIKTLGVPAALVINKIDTVKKEDLLAVMACYGQAHTWAAVLPISAQAGEGLDELWELVQAWLPVGPALFPEDMTTDQPERQVCAEILREKLLLCLDKEVPHGTAVELTKFLQRDRDDVIEIEATIYCERDSHKGIIIGKKGAMLKRISTLARQDMERFMGEKIFLETWVKVKENWRASDIQVRNFGYREE